MEKPFCFLCQDKGCFAVEGHQEELSHSPEPKESPPYTPEKKKQGTKRKRQKPQSYTAGPAISSNNFINWLGPTARIIISEFCTAFALSSLVW